MYKTNNTNGNKSAIQSKSFVHLQQDLLGEVDNAHNPDLLIIDQVFKHYHNTLKLQPKLAKMLVSRKVDPSYIENFHIGFADRTLGYELKSPKCLLGSRNRGHLQRLGLLKDSGHEFFRGALVIPYCNNDGQIIGAYGRRPRHQRRKPAYHLYWNAQRVSLFNATDQRLPKSLILCKSALDVLTLLTAGFNNVVATMGTQGFNEVQLSRLHEDGVSRVFVAFDNTPSANRYALLVAQALDAMGIQCYRIKPPTGQDVNHFAMTQTDVVGAFNRLMDEAVPFKQCYGKLVPGVMDRWLVQLGTLEDCIQFYLEEARHAGKSYRTLNASRIHLERFLDYCHIIEVEDVADLTTTVLESYQQYLQSEKNVFTDNVISLTTQIERMDAVTRMLARLHYYDVIPEPISFVNSCVAVH
ncbi:MAG: toprim domain-containing protein [Candidatus Thiodiazotropha sp. (ex Codakia rugifera)]|nr:toprim domain-containing protein [Candidatus Thiodiazotropha sp. (ex Codakia rugifera)]